MFLLITGVFIAINAKAEHMSSYVSERLDGVKVRDLTWFGVAQAGTDMDADSMLWERQRLGGAGGVAVTDDLGVPKGVVLEDELWAIPADERPWVMLTSMMVPFDGTAQASDADFDPLDREVTFLPGDPLTQQVPLTIRGDNKFEPDENLQVVLESAVDGTIGAGSVIPPRRLASRPCLPSAEK